MGAKSKRCACGTTLRNHDKRVRPLKTTMKGFPRPRAGRRVTKKKREKEPEIASFDNPNGEPWYYPEPW